MISKKYLIYIFKKTFEIIVISNYFHNLCSEKINVLNNRGTKIHKNHTN